MTPGLFVCEDDAAATPAMRHRMERVRRLEEELFCLAQMGDDRAVVATYLMGEPAHGRPANAAPQPGAAMDSGPV